MRVFTVLTILITALCSFSCSKQQEAVKTPSSPTPVPETYSKPAPSPSASTMPNLQAEFLSDKNSASDSPLAKFDFKNFTYPLPRGWQNPDNTDMTLKNGVL
ncbi:MAG: hypothetical protein ABI999_17145, partial [Acidobacteriota bacterium]